MKRNYVLPGAPVPLMRPRFSIRNRSAYDPQAHIKEAAQQILRFQHHSPCPFEEPITVKISFFMPIPKSTPKSKNLNNTPHSKRPDIDNLIKFVLDCCNNLVFKDDSIVFVITAAKLYSEDPRTELEILTLEDKPYGTSKNSQT